MGGHIKGAVNVSSDKFADDDDVADTIAEYLDGKSACIIHEQKHMPNLLGYHTRNSASK